MNIMQILLNQLKIRNPQAFQIIQQAQKNKSNPEEMFKEITKNYKPEQMQQIFDKAKMYGISDDVISKLK